MRTTTLYISNLSVTATEAQLREIFGKYGEIIKVRSLFILINIFFCFSDRSLFTSDLQFFLTQSNKMNNENLFKKEPFKVIMNLRCHFFEVEKRIKNKMNRVD
jgi:RNA recognition motif-containing protein